MGILNKLLGNEGSVSLEEVFEKYGDHLIDGEKIDIAFKQIRDTYIFTSLRLILVDVQGTTGSKKQIMSLPYKNMTRFAAESSGRFDLDAEIKIWISSENIPTVKLKLDKTVDIFAIQKYLATKILMGS